MAGIQSIAVFDVGKTNKKILLFDEQYHVVYEESRQFTETTDEDGFPAEDITALTQWVRERFNVLLSDERFDIRAVNFSGYGASFVYIDEAGEVIAPLYNYLKPYPAALQAQFYQSVGGESAFSKLAASPVLGSLNSGMQLYRLKYEQPQLFARIHCALHLPQYLSYILSEKKCSDLTSIGCHTNLWNFKQGHYHEWVVNEAVDQKLAPIVSGGDIVSVTSNHTVIGSGLHDSSAALIPYLLAFKEPFVLLSTGTWCISLNPFNHSQLSDLELHNDCLSYISFEGKPVKAARLFAGYEHEVQTKRLSEHFQKPADHYKTVALNTALLEVIDRSPFGRNAGDTAMLKSSFFQQRDLSAFDDYETAYHQLMADIITQQQYSTNLVIKGTPVKRIFVDGGFGNNPIYMHLLAQAFPQQEVYAATVPQASALGAALAIHDRWNTKALPGDIIGLRLYTGKQ